MISDASSGKRARKRSSQKGKGIEKLNLSAERLSLAGSDDLFREMVENLNEVVFTVDSSGCFVYISPVIEKISGFTPDDVIGSSFSRFIYPDDLPDVMGLFEKVIGGADNVSAEFRVLIKGGKIRDVHVSTWLMLVEGKMFGLAGVLTDITERKLAQQSMRQNEQEKLAILNAIPDIMFHLDQDGVFLDYKAEQRETLFKSPMEFLGKNIRDVLPEWLSDITLEYLHAAVKTKNIQIYEYQLEMGSENRYFEARMMPFQEDHVLVIIRDMTEQKQAEQAILEAEQKFRALVEQIPAIVYTDSADEIGRTHYISPQIFTILGFPPEEWSKNNDLWTSSIHPDDREHVLSEYNLSYESGEPFLAEYRIYSKSGQLIWIRDEAVLIREQSGRPLLWQGIMLDITERKQAETALMESEERYRKMVELSPEAIAVHINGKIVYINRAGVDLIGAERMEDLIGKPVLEFVHPDFRDQVVKRIQETLRSSNSSGSLREKFVKLDGSIIDVEVSNMPLVFSGKPAIQVMIRDITEQQRVVEERRLNAQRLEVLLRLSQMNMASLDELTEYALEQAVLLTGSTLGYIAFVSEDETILTMHTWSRNAIQADRSENKISEYPVQETGLWKETIRQRRPIITNDYQAPNLRQKGVPDGYVSLSRHMNVPIFDAERVVIVAGVGNKSAPYNEMDVKQLTLLMDGVWQIIRRKQADDALRESENKFRNVVEQATEGMVLVNEQGIIIEFNQAIAETTGIDRNKVIGIPFWELQLNISDKKRSEYFKKIVLEALRTGQASFFNRPVDVIVTRPDGKKRFVEQISFIVKTGKGYQISSLFRDITDRKQADDALRSSEASYRGLFDSVSEAVYVQDHEGRFLDVNQGAVNMYGYPREFFIGKTPADVGAPGKNDFDKLKIMTESAFAGEPQQFEFWGKRKNGEIFPKEVRLYTGTYFGKDILFALAQDITERKRNEDALHRRDAILEAVGFASEQFLRSPDWRQSIQAVVERLGQAADTSRAYIFENFTDPGGDLLLRQIYERCAEGIVPQMDNDVFQHISYRKDGFSRWKKTLEKNQIISGHVATFPTTEQTVLVPQGIISLLVMPIFVGSAWWGFIGFDECRHERVWHPTEIEALRTAASLMGAAIQKMEADKAHLRQLQELEVLHAVSLACMKAAIVDELIENVTSIVIDAFHFDSFGVMLFDPLKKTLNVHPSYHGDFKKKSLEQIPLGKGVVGYVAETRLPYRVNDVRKEKRYLQVDPGVCSELCVPILAGEKIIGILNAESFQLNFFTNDTERLLSTIAVTMATTLEKLSLFESEYLHRQEAERLRDASTALTSSLELQPLLNNILESLVKIVPHDSASIVLREKNGLRIVAARAIPETVQYYGRVFPLNKKWETIIETRQALILEDAQNSPDFEKWAGSDYIHGWMGIPLLVRGELLGCICIDSQKPNAFSQEHAALAQTFANHAATAIENAHLFAAEREQRYRQDAMVDLMKIAALSLDLDTVLENTLVYLLRLIPGKAGTIQLLEGDQLRIAAMIGYEEEQLRPGVCMSLAEYPLNQQIISEKRAVCLGDTWKDDRYIHLPSLNNIISFLGVPLVFKENVIGIITLDSDQYNAFSEQDVELVFAVARNISMAVENARLFDSERTRRREADILRQAAAVVSSSLDLDKVLQTILVSMSEVVPYDSASVILENGEELEIVAERGLPQEVPLTGQKFGKSEYWRQLVETQKPIILADAQIDPLFEKREGSYNIHSWMGIPLIVRGKVIGDITLDSRHYGAYTEETANLAQAFVHQAAIAVENARLYRQALEAADRRVILHQASEEIARSSQDPEKVYDAVHRAAKRLMPAEAFVISLVDEARDDIYSAYLYDKDGRWPASHVPKDSGISGQVIATGKALTVNNLLDISSFNAVHFGNEEEVRSFLAVPMMLGDAVIGMLSAQSYRPNIYTEEDQRLLEMLAAHASVAIENARLYQQAVQDAERRGILYRISQDMVTAIREPEKTYRSIHQATRQLMACDSFVIGLHDEVSNENIIVYALEGDHRFPVQHILAGKGLIGGVVANGESIILDDLLTEDKNKEVIRIGEPQPIRSIVAVPLRLGQRTTGMLSAQSYKIHAYVPQDREILEMLASYAAVAIENARLYQEAVRAAERRSILHEVSQEIVKASLDPERVYEAVHHAAERLMPTEAFTLSLLDEVHNEIIFAYLFDEGKRWPSEHAPLGVGLSGRVIETGKAILVNDLQSTPIPDSRDFGEGEEVRSLLAVPLRLGTKVFGMLSVQSYQPNSYSEEDQALLEMLGAHAAVAIDNVRLFDQIQRRRVEAESLRDATTALTSTLEIDQVMNRLLDALAQVISFDSATVFLRERDAIMGKVAHGLPFPEKVIGQKFSLTDPLFQHIIETRKPLVIRDVHEDARFQYIGETNYIHGWMGIPLIIRNEVVGLLTVDSRTPGAYTETETELALAFANQAATAVEKARLFEETLHRLSELEVVNRVSTQLRSATKVEEMLTCLLDETLRVLNTDSGSIWLYDPTSGLLKTPLARGWFLQLGDIPIKPGEGVAGHVFSTGETIISKEFSTDPLPRLEMRGRIPSGWGGGCVPIRSGQETIGVMFIAVPLPRELQESDVHLLTTLCEIAGNAIRRADLHEQTERQLQRLASLRTIDMAISTILDLRVTLGILIDHIISQLKVDAVNVLLINPNTQTLYPAASSGFWSDAVRNSQVYINDGLALQAIRSRTTVFIPNLAEASAFPRLQLLTGEGFVTYFGVPLIAKGQVKGILETFHRHSEDPDMDWRGFLETLSGQAAIAIDNSLLFEELQQTNLNLSLAYDATIEGWSKALDLRDRETEGHTLRVTEMTLLLADAMGIGTIDLVNIRRGALLHDIGKMGVPDSILHKTGPLTEDEWIVMRRHPEFAYAMLSPIAYLRPALDVPYCHHERWDGSGYPRTLKEDQIPLAARLFAVVDVWDALISTRPYRKGWTKRAATDFIRKNSGILFDPKVVETFLMMLSKSETGR